METLGKVIYTGGFWIRNTGQALDRLGCRFLGKYYLKEQLSRHRTLMNVFDRVPVVDKYSASVIGDVMVGRGSSIWYGEEIWLSFLGSSQKKRCPSSLPVRPSAINYSNLGPGACHSKC